MTWERFRPVVKVFEVEGEKKYQPCILRYTKGSSPSAGELYFDEFVLVDTLEEASKKASALYHEAVKLIEEVRDA